LRCRPITDAKYAEGRGAISESLGCAEYVLDIRRFGDRFPELQNQAGRGDGC